MLKKIYSLFLIGLVICNTENGNCSSAGFLEGRISDKNSKEYLTGVNISLLDTKLGTAADKEGFYVVNNIPPGDYDVKYSLLGYKTVIMKGVVILGGRRTKIDVEMIASAVEMDVVEIVVQKPLIQKEQPATVYSIGELKIEKLPVSNFRELISLQPGITPEGNVRGGKTNEVMYLIDGLPVQDVLSGGLGTNLPKSSITGINIHAGGFDAEYGNALSGIVNIITKTGSDKHKFSLRVERDNWAPEKLNKQQDRLTEIELSAGGPIAQNSLYYQTSNIIHYSDTRWWLDFKQFGISPVNCEFSGFGKLEYLISKNIKVGFQGIYSLRNWNDYEFSWRFNLPGLPKRERNSYRVALMLSHTFSQTSYYTLSLSRYFLGTSIGEDKKELSNLTPYEYDFFLRYIVAGKRNWWADTRQIVYTLKGDITTILAKIHIIKVGMEINQYDLFSDVLKYDPQLSYFGKPLFGVPLLNYSNRYNYFPRSGSIYLQDKIENTDDGSQLSFGVRWDFLDPTAERPVVEFIPTRPGEYRQVVMGSTKAKFKHQISPRIAIALPVGLASFMFVNFGYYFQYPLFDHLYSGISPSQIKTGSRNVLVGNPDLEPEKTIAWEAGLKHGFSANITGSITYFKKKTKNQIDSKTLIPFDSKSAGDFGFAEYVNNAEAAAEGLEFVVSKENDKGLSGSISYSYMTTEGISEYVDQTINRAQWGFPLAVQPFPLSWDQRHTIKVDADIILPGEIQTNLIVLYNTPRPYTFYPTRDGYNALDSTKAFLPNNFRMEEVLFINLKFSKTFNFGKERLYRLTMFADVRNILNRANVKWIDSSGRIGGELKDPGAYYDPRRIRVGAVIDF